MAVQGISARDFFDLARFAWVTYENIRLSRQRFADLNLDVECLLISVSTLDQGHTGRLVAEYIDSDPSLEAYIEDNIAGSATSTKRPSVSQRQVEVRALRDGLHSVIFPFYVFLEKYAASFASSESGEKRLSGSDNSNKGVSPEGRGRRQPRSTGGFSFSTSMDAEVNLPSFDMPIPQQQTYDTRKRWFQVPVWVGRLCASFDLKDMSDIRTRFAVQAANLNLFLTRLTHTQLQKQSELLTLRLAEDNLLSQSWEYSRDLKQGEAKFRQDVAVYVQHLLKGGMPFTEQELRKKQRQDNFAKQSREDRKWAAEKIAIENRRFQEGGNGPTVHYLGSGSTAPDNRSEATSKEDGLRHTLYDREFAAKQKLKQKPTAVRNPIETGLSLDALRCLDEARKRVDDAEKQGLLLNNDARYEQDETLSPPSQRRSETLSTGRDDSKRHSFPGIMVSPPTQYAEPVSSEERKGSPGELPNPREGSPKLSNASSSTSIPQAEPMRHSLSASPQVRPAQPARVPSGTASTERRPVTPVRRSPVRVRLCDHCESSIRLNEYFWRCSTGKCAHEGSSYDLCRRCIDRGYRCRGEDAGTCAKMICTVVKDTAV